MAYTPHVAVPDHVRERDDVRAACTRVARTGWSWTRAVCARRPCRIGSARRYDASEPDSLG